MLEDHRSDWPNTEHYEQSPYIRCFVATEMEDTGDCGRGSVTQSKWTFLMSYQAAKSLAARANSPFKCRSRCKPAIGAARPPFLEYVADPD